MPASDGYSSHQDAIRYLSRHDQIKAAATGGRPSRRFSRAILLLLGVSRNGKMQQRQRPATTVVASPRQWRIFVAYPSDSLRGLRYAFPEEVPAMKRFALIIPCPIGLSPFWHFACSYGSCARCAHAFRDAHIAPWFGRARSSSFATEMDLRAPADGGDAVARRGQIERRNCTRRREFDGTEVWD